MKILTFIFIVFFVLASCGDKYETRMLYDHIVDLIPYHQSELVVFTGTNDDIFKVRVEIVDNQFESHLPCAECKHRPYESERTYRLVNENKNISNPVFAKFYTSSRQLHSSVIFLTVYSQSDLGFGKGFDLKTDEVESEFICDTKQICHPAYTLNNREYTDVLELVAPSSLPDILELTHIYYNKQHGIIAFMYDDSTFYYLNH